MFQVYLLPTTLSLSLSDVVTETGALLTPGGDLR
jgi:hypothetical protein